MAITATVTATIITITSTGGVEESFDDCVTAINAVTAGTITGSGTSGDPYIITTPSGWRRISFNNGTIVRVASGTYISWGNITTSGQYAFYALTGSILDIDDGCYIDQSAGTAGIQVYNAFYGTVNVNGTSGSRVVFKGMTRNYMYFSTDAVTWDYFDITDMRPITGYAMYFTQVSATAAPNMTFSNFRILNSATAYGANFTAGGMYGNVTIHSFDMDGCVYGVIAAGCSVKIGDTDHPSIIQNSVNPGIYFQGSGNVVSPAYETSKDDTTFPNGRFQSMGVVEGVTFKDNDAGLYSIFAYYNSLVQIRDCTFVGDTYSGTQDGTYARYGSVIIEYNNTYTDIDREFIWGENSTRLHGRKFDILVQDADLDPIEDATVSWVQGSTPSKERWSALTNSAGRIVNVFGESPMLIEKEETAASTFAQWSNDDTSGLCHYLTVSKYGYVTQTACYEMTEDKDVIVTLVEPYVQPSLTSKKVLLESVLP